MNNMSCKRKCSICRRPGHDRRNCFKQSFGKSYKLLQEYIHHVPFGILLLIKEKSSINNNTTKAMSGSETAKSGFKAEKKFMTNPEIKKALEVYFDKSIREIRPAPSRHKYDSVIDFEDGTSIRIQNKKIIGLGGRGDSFDRRHISHTFKNRFIKKYFTKLALIRPSSRKTSMSPEQKKDFIRLCNTNLKDIKQYLHKTLIGNGDNKNDYWVIMKTDKEFVKMELFIIDTITLYTFLEKSISINIKLKENGTCLHISPNISLQRKGGTHTDHAPNHIQAKLKITQNILDLCAHIL